jgi:hypothetical protein
VEILSVYTKFELLQQVHSVSYNRRKFRHLDRKYRKKNPLPNFSKGLMLLYFSFYYIALDDHVYVSFRFQGTVIAMVYANITGDVVVGGDGTVYCSSQERSHVYLLALTSSLIPIWNVSLGSYDPYGDLSAVNLAPTIGPNGEMFVPDFYSPVIYSVTANGQVSSRNFSASLSRFSSSISLRDDGNPPEP